MLLWFLFILLVLARSFFGYDWSICQVWWGIMALERVCSSVMWPQQMAQLSIRVGSPAVCSPVSCFTAIKYHQGSGKKGRKEQGREWEKVSEGKSKKGNKWKGWIKRRWKQDEEMMSQDDRGVCYSANRGGTKDGGTGGTLKMNVLHSLSDLFLLITLRVPLPLRLSQS